MYNITPFLPLIQTCIDRFCINIEHYQITKSPYVLYTDAIAQHKKYFSAFCLSITKDEITRTSDELITHAIKNDIPYLFLTGEFATVSKHLLGEMIQQQDFENLHILTTHLGEHCRKIDLTYFKLYLSRLCDKNHSRLSSVQKLTDKRLMIHYENHLIWMAKLITHVQSPLFSIHPELRPTHCEFGKWLTNVQSTCVVSKKHIQQIDQLHTNLHDLAANLSHYLSAADVQHSTIIHLLQRIDYTSLEIGNEISIINEIEASAKDPLTDLLSRRLLSKIFSNQIEIATAIDAPSCFILCDLDHFKSINDTYGHIAGDAVLKNFAKVLKSIFRKSDYIFRFGGEEFLIILPSTTLDEAHKLANTICSLTSSQQVAIDDTYIEYTSSAGVTLINTDYPSLDYDELLKEYIAIADANLYQAKANGRNQIF